MKMSNRETVKILNTEISELSTLTNKIDTHAGMVFGGSKFGKELSDIKSSIRTFSVKYKEEVEVLDAIRTRKMEVLYIGHYKPYMKDDGILVLDAVAWALDPRDPNSVIKTCMLNAFDNDVSKVMDLYPLDIIAGKFSYNPDNFKNGNNFEISTSKTTDLTPRNEMAGNQITLQERRESVLSAYPIIPVAELGDNVSKLKKNKNKLYIDTLDLKHIKCVITSYKESLDDAGEAIPWTILTVTEGSIPISKKTKPITVWATPDITHKVGTGEGSLVHILGYISRNAKNGTPEMTACAILPIIAMPIKTTDGKVNAGNNGDSVNAPKASNVKKDNKRVENSI